MALHLLGIGHFHPENTIDNDFLADLDIGVDVDWILERVGIRERRTVLPLDYIRHERNRDLRAAQEAAVYSLADSGERAARLALERAGLSSEAIGLVLFGTCCPDFAIPAEACRVAAQLGIEAPALDLNSGCASFGAHLHFLANMRPEAVPDYVLIVQAEHMTRVVDYADRADAVLWGDGAAAAVVSAHRPGRALIDLTSLGSNPSAWSKVVVPRLEYFDQQGRAVQTFAIRRTRQIVEEITARAGLDAGTFSFVGHQANLLMLQAVCRYCEIPDHRHACNVIDYGNTGAAGAPAVLSQCWDDWGPGDEVVVAVVGAGLSWSGLRLRFTGNNGQHIPVEAAL